MSLFEQYNHCLKNYPNQFIYGYSVLKQPLICAEFGNKNGKSILMQSGIHAREWITTYYLDRFIKEFLLNNANLNNHYYCVISSNPDGFRASTDGIEWIKDTNRKQFLFNINKSINFAQWKANLNAVDLNVNFNAKWGSGAKNNRTPSSENYIGYYPNSEPETMALIELTKKINPQFTFSFHSKGEEIYYEFGQNKPHLIRDYKIARDLSYSTQYNIKSTANSSGGYKDWCISKLNIPSFTIELGKNNWSHPIDLMYLEEIFVKTKKIFEILEKL